MNYQDYSFKFPPKFSSEFERDYMSLKSLDLEKGSGLWRKFYEKYATEIKKAESILAENASNFIFLTEMREVNRADKSLIDSILNQFRRSPGFFISNESGRLKFICVYQKALNIFNYVSENLAYA